MPLLFPNRSRVFDATRRAVRFWGHDSAMEFSFFVSEDVLLRIAAVALVDEAALLRAFDAKPRSCPCCCRARVRARPKVFLRFGLEGSLRERSVLVAASHYHSLSRSFHRLN
jgi:uncharacterized protein DUF1488